MSDVSNSWAGGGCSLGADQAAHLAHLNARDTTLVYASRAPQADIARLKARMGWGMPWGMPWYTITDSFDADSGVDEWHGHNAFIRDSGRIFRTYFINGRGDEAMASPPMNLKDRRCTEMISKVPGSIDREVTPCQERLQASPDHWLSLAAVPTFAMMALLTRIRGGSAPDMLCSAAQGHDRQPTRASARELRPAASGWPAGHRRPALGGAKELCAFGDVYGPAPPVTLTSDTYALG